jgi:integrase/recombinase XerD
VEEAVLHPRRPRDARPLRRESRPGPQHAAPPLAPLPFTWLKTDGIDDALIQPYRGHTSGTSLEIYSKIALGSAQDACKSVIDQFPV